MSVLRWSSTLALWRKSAFLQLTTLHTSRALSVAHEDHIAHCYALLNVSEECTVKELKEAYLEQVKLYHPDSHSERADTETFTRVKDAYTTLLNDRGNVEESVVQSAERDLSEPDIQHTVPQHRQFLSNEGLGFGPPGVRQRQHQQYRLHKATEAATDYKLNHVLAECEANLTVSGATKRRSKDQASASMDRPVDDFISASITKGMFDNLPGQGKPIDYDKRHNPMLDSMENNLNRILIDNGYVPEWVQLQKDIGEDIAKCRHTLLEKRLSLLRNTSLSSKQFTSLWSQYVTEFGVSVQKINRSVDNFNLQVPCVWKQRMHFMVDRELKKILEKSDNQIKDAPPPSPPNTGEESSIQDTERSHDHLGLKAIFSKFKTLWVS